MSDSLTYKGKSLRCSSIIVVHISGRETIGSKGIAYDSMTSVAAR